MESTFVKSKFDRLRNLAKGEGLFKNVIFLVSGNGIAQILSLCASPFLTRLYNAKEFGQFGVFNATLAIILLVATFRLDYAIVLPKTSRIASRVGLAAFYISCAFSLLIYVLFKWVGVPILNYFNHLELVPLVGFFAINLWLMGIYSILNFWATRTNQFVGLAWANILNNGMTGLLQIFLQLGGSSHGLVIGQLVGRLMALAFLIRNLFSSLKSEFNERVKLSEVIENAKNYSSFAASNMVPTLLDSVIVYLPTFFFFNFYSATEAGYYLLAYRIIGAPMALVTNSSCNALLPRLTLERYPKPEIHRVMSLAFRKLFLFGILLLPVLILGAAAFPFIFGTQWSTASNYGYWVALPLAVKMIVQPLSGYLFCNDNLTYAKWQLFYFVVILIGMALLVIARLTPLQAIRALSILDLFMLILYFLVICRSAGMSALSLVRARS